MSGFAIWEESLLLGDGDRVKTDFVIAGISDESEAKIKVREFLDFAPEDDRKLAPIKVDQSVLDAWNVKSGEVKRIAFFDYEPPFSKHNAD